MFGKKKQRISDLRTACISAKLVLDEASTKSLFARSEVLSIAQDIKSVDENLYKRLLTASIEIDHTSDLIARAWATLAVASGSTDE